MLLHSLYNADQLLGPETGTFILFCPFNCITLYLLYLFNRITLYFSYFHNIYILVLHSCFVYTMYLVKVLYAGLDQVVSFHSYDACLNNSVIVVIYRQFHPFLLSPCFLFLDSFIHLHVGCRFRSSVHIE